MNESNRIESKRNESNRIDARTPPPRLERRTTTHPSRTSSRASVSHESRASVSRRVPSFVDSRLDEYRRRTHRHEPSHPSHTHTLHTSSIRRTHIHNAHTHTRASFTFTTRRSRDTPDTRSSSGESPPFEDPPTPRRLHPSVVPRSRRQTSDVDLFR